MSLCRYLSSLFRESFLKNGKQSDCKPGSVAGREFRSVVRHLSTTCVATSSVLPSTLGGLPSNGSLHELAAPKMHSQCVTTLLVGSYPTFSPLLHRSGAVVFFCITQPSRTASILGSRMPCAARTFLFRSVRTASDEPSDCFPTAKIS